jgi:hypothetical protein
VPTSRARGKLRLGGDIIAPGRHRLRLTRARACRVAPADCGGTPAPGKGGNQCAPSCIQLSTSCSGTLRRRSRAPPWYPREPGRSTRLRRPSASARPTISEASMVAHLLGCRGPGAAPTWRWPAGTSNHIETKGLGNCSHALVRSSGGDLGKSCVWGLGVRANGMPAPERRLAPHTLQKLKKFKERAEATGA